MGFSHFSFGLVWRSLIFLATLSALVLVITQTHWYATALILIVASLAEIVWLNHFANRANQRLARFIEALAYDDVGQSFAITGRNRGERALVQAMAEAMARLGRGRAEREAQARQLEALLHHVPVALIGYDEEGIVELLNPAARRLFPAAPDRLEAFAVYGAVFAETLAALKPGQTQVLRLEHHGGVLHLKAAATGFSLRGRRQRLISLQNIGNELNAQEVFAWQTVIRTMAHEMMNSLTPIASLSATALDLVEALEAELPSPSPQRATLGDVRAALETVARRSEGLSQFVDSHRRLAQHLTVRPERLSLARVFARIERLLAADLKARGIAVVVRVDPVTLEVTADGDLIDQALINLLRNAMDAVAGIPDATIELTAQMDSDRRCAITVTDNGPGVPAALREKIFVPFYTTKPHGNGIGLSLVRQIAAVHNATLAITEASHGGAVFTLRF